MTELNLLNKMNDWGPFEEREAKWLIFTVGNPNEGHGFALPRTIDDFHAKKSAFDLVFHTGQRYVAHVPYTTDRCGPVAKDWAPNWLPWEEFLKKTIDFMKYHIELIKERNEEISRVMLIIGHGGNFDLTRVKYRKQIEKELGLKRFIAISALVSAKQGIRVLNELEPLASKIIKERGERFGYKDPEELSMFYTRLLMSSGHASHMEHSLAAAMGLCDLQKVEIMNQLLQKDFEAALKEWPPLGGLGGYLLAGGKYTEALGTKENDKFGLWNCLNGLKTINNGKLVIAPELGTLIHEVSLETKSEIINKYI